MAQQFVGGEVLNSGQVMEGQSLIALYGEVGAGKTNRMVEQLLDELRRGSYCIWVNTRTQTLDVDAVANYLGDDTVHNRVVCVTMEDICKPDFWPVEHQALSTQWKNATFRAGARMFWDEAWDLLDKTSTITIPDPKRPGDFTEETIWKTEAGKRIKRMLRKLRHWKGPANYKDPKTQLAVSDPTWSPERSEAEDDGVEMISCGVMFATQQYMALDLEVRRSVQAVLFLRTYGSTFKGMLFGRLADKYRELAIKGNQVPKKMDVFDSDPNIEYTIRQHVPEIHALTNKIRGSERSMISRVAGKKRSMRQWMVIIGLGLYVLAMIAGVGYLVWRFLLKSDDPEPVRKAPTSISGSRSPTSTNSSQGASQAAPRAVSSMRVIGQVGSSLLVTDGTRTWFESSSSFVRTEVGYVGTIDNQSVTEWTGSLAPASDAGRSSGRSSSGSGVSPALVGG